MSKVQSPFLVGGRVLTKRCALPNAVFTLLAPQSQTCLSINPVHALVVHYLTQTGALEIRLGAGDWYRAAQIALDEDPVKAAEDVANSETYWPNEI